MPSFLMPFGSGRCVGWSVVGWFAGCLGLFVLVDCASWPAPSGWGVCDAWIGLAFVVGFVFVWLFGWPLCWGWLDFVLYGEFDPGSGRTLAACLTHASRTMKPSLLGGLVANG